MINYTEKGIGLHRAVVAAGHWLMEIDGVWQSSDDTAVQAIIDAYSLEDCKNEVCTAISAHAKSLRDKAVENVSAGEMASWPIKRAEATAFVATGNADVAPMLTAEASARGVTLLEMISKVSGNAARLSLLEAQIGGIDGRHRDTVRGLADFDSVLSYDWRTSWPMV
ncbi:MAG TPA: hypothetical protein VK165_09405 [Azonexus sp.]|nr:hypothetical protein [Azonexus sp.]